MQNRFPTAALLLALIAAVSAPSLAAGQALERIRSSGMVRVGHRTDAPPFSFAGR